jgi:LysM repeat protein
MVGVIAAGCSGAPETAVTADVPAASELPEVEPAATEVVLASFTATEAGPPLVDNGEPLAVYVLRRGETLDHFARWSGLPVEEIADRSGLPLDTMLEVGTAIAVPVDADGRARIEGRRDAHHLRRAEGYLASRGGATGSEFYRVRTGDTAWSIAEAHGDVPVWLVETYNPSIDLDALRPGMELLLPVLN